MTTGMPTARYDQFAEFYQAGFQDQYEDPVSPALFALLEDVRGKRILDLACGQGRITRELARRGANVVGLDLSQAMLDRALATQRTEPLTISYIQGDAASPSILLGEQFDAVTSSFGLGDIDDLDGTFATVARVLSRTGRFVFSLLHPCFGGGHEVSASWPSSGSYYDEGWWLADGSRSQLRQRVGGVHRMLSTYVTALGQHGLVMETLREPPPPRAWLKLRTDASKQPAFLVARAEFRRP